MNGQTQSRMPAQHELDAVFAEAQARALLPRICVRAPYFALHTLCSPEPGTALAWLAPEQPLGAESGPIAAAEVGRHLAILGSAAAASLAPDGNRRHYLARAAHFERMSGQQAPARKLVAEANARLIDTRAAIAHGMLRTASGAVTHRMSVEYALLGARTFERMFRARRRLVAPSAHNPHADPLLFAIDALDERRARAGMRFGADQCAGHFEGFPAVPVARLMQGLVTLAGHVFQQRVRDTHARYAVMRADMRATQLAFADDDLVLSAEHVCDRGGERRLRCSATLRDGAPIGDLDVWLAQVE
jgi:hypothetical protein